MLKIVASKYAMIKNTFFIFTVSLAFVLYACNNSGKDEEPLATTVRIPTTGYTSPSSYPNMDLLWADEFNTTSLSAGQWNFQIGNGCPAICGWGNNESEYYKKENTTLKDGFLIIEAKKENEGNNQYTSSRINTQGKFSFHYGRVDVRAVLPEGKGIWPAIWMLGENISTVGWPASGEIDIMEMIGGGQREKTIHGTAHWSANGNHAQSSGSYSLSSGTFHDEFHVFSILWNAEKISWYVDDIKYHEVAISPSELSAFQKDFHFLINLAVGGNWPGNPDTTTPFPQYLIVDYIRVFQ